MAACGHLVRLPEVRDLSSHGLVTLGEQPRHVPRTPLGIVDCDVGVNVVHRQVSVYRCLSMTQRGA